MKYKVKFGTIEKWYSINEVTIEADSEEEAERILLENYSEVLENSTMIDNDFLEILDSDPDILSIEEK